MKNVKPTFVPNLAPNLVPSLVPNLVTTLVAALVAAIAAPLWAAESGSGYFRFKENKQSYSHSVALSREDAWDPSVRKIHVYLTTHPVDPSLSVSGFDIDDGITEQLRDVGGGMTRITLDGDGNESGVWFWVSDPSDSFNTSGFGELTLSEHSDGRVAGRFAVDEPQEFFDDTYQYDLQFDATITNADFRGEALASGGGEPGKVWLEYIGAVLEGDVKTLRALMGEEARWMFPEDDEESTQSSIEMMQYGLPRDASVVGGWLMDGRAILKVKAKDEDGNKQQGLVEMIEDGGRWSEGSRSLDTVWE